MDIVFRSLCFFWGGGAGSVSSVVGIRFHCLRAENKFQLFNLTGLSFPNLTQLEIICILTIFLQRDIYKKFVLLYCQL